MRYTLAILLTLLASRASAQMVAAPGLGFLRAEYGHTFSYLETGYSFKGFRTVGFSAYSFNTGNGPSFEAEVASVNQLIKRWNEPEEQANLYVGAGFGRGRLGSRSGLAGALTFQADWENRSWHAMLQEQAIFVPGGSRLASTLHLGWAPWLAEYDEWAPWIYWAVMHDNGFDGGISHGPQLVLMHRAALYEFRVMRSRHGYHAEAGLRLLF